MSTSAVAIANQGTISADVAGGTIAFANGNGMSSNTGTLEAKNNGTLAPRGAWSNSGTINVNNGHAEPGRDCSSTAGVGTITRTGGLINLTGTLQQRPAAHVQSRKHRAARGI